MVLALCSEVAALEVATLEAAVCRKWKGSNQRWHSNGCSMKLIEYTQWKEENIMIKKKLKKLKSLEMIKVMMCFSAVYARSLWVLVPRKLI